MAPALLIALAAGAMAAPSPPINQGLFGAPPAPGLRLGDARIGMTLAQWKAAPLPGGVSPRAEAQCESASAGAPSGGIHNDPLSARDPILCGYATRYGKASLTQSLRINRNYLARNPKYMFLNNHLVEIQFQASIDAFNAVTAAIEQAYGPATETLRDVGPKYDGVRRPRVKKVWRLAAGSIQVIDPSSRPDELAVRLSARADGRAFPLQPAPTAAGAARSADARGGRRRGQA